MSLDDKPTRRTLLRSVAAGVTLGMGGLAVSTSATATSPAAHSLSELQTRDGVRLRDVETEDDCETKMACLQKFCEPGYTYGQQLRCCGDDCEVVEAGCLCHS